MIPSFMSKLCWRYFFGFTYRARDLYEHNTHVFCVDITRTLFGVDKTRTRFVVLNRARVFLNSNFYSLQMIRPSLHPCFRGIPIPMCLLYTLLRINMPMPWSMINHGKFNIISIFSICSCLTVRLIVLHTSIFYEILETDMVFFADSKYVNFNKNT